MPERTAAQRRVNSRTESGRVRYPVRGTEAYEPYIREGTASRSRHRTDGGTAVRSRKRTAGMTAGYVLFLFVISAATVVMCVRYLRLKETITAQNSRNEKLEAELVSLRSENDALLENVRDEIDWEYIRDTAVNKLGMKYASEDQIVWYNSESSSYIRQYGDVPHASP